MKKVQDALRGVGLQVFPDAWRPMGESQNPPAQYMVYTTSTVPDENTDDAMQSVRIYVYLNLWSEGDPTGAAAKVRRAMMKAGFGMIEEETGTGSATRYDESTHRHAVFWTWVLHERADGDVM